ncbi:coagulation factor XI-like [Scomber japonicus]|uniref:coagulation factor XI-like n=1 Tax=Scomber japonicus TaxID=13676 RepID=UPI00230576F0|nr:coagulation factor XI-like [Scomber japonicus]
MGTLFILVGLIYHCGLSFTQACRSDLLKDTNFPGNDITVLHSPDAEHCQLLCTQHPYCHFFSFVQPDSTTDRRYYKCYLKSTPLKQPKVRISQQGITSGFSLKTCHPDPRPCLPHVYDKVDFPFADYRTLFTADYQECQRACTHDPGCQFFAFIKTSYKCWLKTTWTVPTIALVKAKPGDISGFSHRIQTSEYFETACQGKLFPRTDIPGHDIVVLPAASPEHCQTLCTAHPLCTYFSYVSHQFRCYLKKNEAVMARRPHGDITSGLPARFCQLDNSWIKKTYAGVDFQGSDLRSLLVNDVETCQRTCTADPNCQFYTFSTNSSPLRRRCYLKRSITMPAPPRINKNDNNVSGFSLRNCQYKIA